MCGINGIIGLAGGPRDGAAIDRDELLRTREAMTARGPDGAGAWVAEDGSVGLAARRLAILDLSAAGAQPMAAAAGAVQLVFNGEIYNFQQLRAELAAAGSSFRGHSDTEVILALYLLHGDAFLGRLRGMFGLAIWDGRTRRLLLARDPLGIKPLYYAAGGGRLRFASQVRALLAGGALARTVDPAGLAGFLLWGSVPEPFTFYEGIRALPAGHLLAVEDGRLGEPRRFAEPAAASALPTAPAAPASGATGTGDGPTVFHPPGAAPTATAATDADAETALAAAAIEDSVAAHLVSDVPVAIFLSAGLDSGLIAALACRHLAPPPTTLTLAFDVLAGTPRDEAPLAAAVAKRLGTRHVEQRLGRDDFARLWPAALAAMDQPSIDGFNTFAVSQAAHQAGLKVVLSGLGGDELFGSYPSFADVPRLARMARWGRRVPGLATLWPPLARRCAPSRPKLAGLLRHGASLPGSYFLRRALFLPEELPDLMGRDAAAAGLAAYDPIADAARRLDGAGRDPWVAVHRMEAAQYMRNQLLRDADWASMACSVELRVPLVDAWLYHRLATAHFQPARRLGKAALVRRIAPELPDALWRRPKSGFYVPVLEWLRPGELGPAAQNLGGRSRALARLVLEELGAPLPGPARR
jgi:asparagine synthase (glutamine-hydrolysing)